MASETSRIRFCALILLLVTGNVLPSCSALDACWSVKAQSVAPAASGASPAPQTLSADLQCDSAALIIPLRDLNTLFQRISLHSAGI